MLPASAPSWPNVLRVTNELAQSIGELTKLINVQLLLNANHASIKSVDLRSELGSQKKESIQLNMSLVGLQRKFDSTTREVSLFYKLFTTYFLRILQSLLTNNIYQFKFISPARSLVTVSQLQHQLTQKDRELEEMKSAFFERGRRMDALEAHVTATTAAATTIRQNQIHESEAEGFFGSASKETSGHFFSNSSV
jgi:hypothetical protein